MILSRIIHHLKTQNWTAVAIEFVIVIAGVVIGFQVTAWNAARQDRAAEAAYLARLHAEVAEAEADRFGLLENVGLRSADAASVIEVIFGDADPADLPDTACTSIARLSIFYLEGHALPTLDEMLATGNLDILRDEALRTALTRHQSFAVSAGERFRIIHNDKPDLKRLYPELIRAEPGGARDDLRFQAAECDYAAMRENPAFRTDLLDLAGRATFFRDYALGQERSRFDALHREIDRVLDLTHDRENP